MMEELLFWCVGGLACYMFFLHHLTTKRLQALSEQLALYAKPIEDTSLDVEEIKDKLIAKGDQLIRE